MDNLHTSSMNVADSSELRYGMTFCNEEAAYDAYNTYAISMGFGVRKGQKKYNVKKELRQCIFMCSREGYRWKTKEREGTKSTAKQVPKFFRVESRCGCNALIKFSIKGGIWTITQIILEHNHDFVKEDHKPLIRSGRKIGETSRGLINSMKGVGIGTTKTYSYMANAVGGSRNLNFTKRDCQNHVQVEREKKTFVGDAQTLINHFKCLQLKDPSFYYDYQKDENCRLTSVFWRDGVSKLDYDCFGDVVIFDTTYRTNKYNMICAPFVGVNHHWKNVYFGCAFLLHETISSFVWLFRTFLKSMGDKPPKTIFTDQDFAMANAIPRVFTKISHRLCEWHISKNASKNIGHLFRKPGLKSYFNKVLYGCESKTEFEVCWRYMIVHWKLFKVSWLRRLYLIRHKWSPPFSLGTFSAGIITTQRSESTNRVFQNMACKSMKLSEFVRQYEEATTRMRETEVEDDYSSARGKPHIRIPHNEILKHASSIYTHKIFKMFQDEFVLSMSQEILSFSRDCSTNVYVLQSSKSVHRHVVHFSLQDLSISCSCKLFETTGWLCRHVLRVLTGTLGNIRLPTQYILPRWSKSVKEEQARVIVHEMEDYDLISLKNARWNKLMRKSFDVMSIAAADVGGTKIALKYLDQALLELKAREKAHNNPKDDTLDGEVMRDIDTMALVVESLLLDPLKVRGKGSYKRLKSVLEKRKKRAANENTMPKRKVRRTSDASSVTSITNHGDATLDGSYVNVDADLSSMPNHADEALDDVHVNLNTLTRDVALSQMNLSTSCMSFTELLNQVSAAI